ncbi:MAG TPA: serine/threonine-protein kinase [Phycisphaerae bacterium]|nr:serine/threonine-protein kinase [Phycisphaerae bacterium]
MAQQNSNGPTTASIDTELGRLVVDQQLATQEEVNHCLSVQAAQGGSGETFASVLVREGVVTPRQIHRLKKTIETSRRQQIPGYVILEKLGSGAMATVFKARQLSLDRVVAIKVLPKRLSENAEYVERFYKEGKAAARLNHANIVQAIDVGEAAGYHYFVMEYVDGHTLGEELDAGKVFSEAEALDIVIQIARALEHAHAQGFVHRDVKPKNIMITREGVAKLADMGLARATSDTDAAQAEAGKAYGTPYYISPEQIRGEVDIDFRADIYALGATLYQLVTGRVPFQAPTPAAVMHKHLKEPLVPPDHVNTRLSAGLGEVVEVMMAKDRNRRYASTSDVLLDLEAIAAGGAPLQARRQYDAAALTHLADEAGGSAAETDLLPPATRNVNLLVVVLAVALALSMLFNLLLAVLLASS